MDESTFEMFEEELRSSMQQESARKPVRHARRADTQSLKRMMENLPSPQPAPKVAQQEMSHGLSLRRALSIPSLSQIEAPWKNITLNRCLILAITVVLIGSSFQRLYEVLQAWRGKDDPEVPDLHGLYLRHVSLKQGVSLQQAESSLWENWFWNWILDDEDEDEDDDDDDEENLKGRAKKKGDQRRGARESVKQLKQKKAIEKKVVREQEGKASDKKEKKERDEKRESFREMAKGHRDREKVSGRGFEDKEEETAKGKRHKAEGLKQLKRQQETAEVKRARIRAHRHSI